MTRVDLTEWVRPRRCSSTFPKLDSYLPPGKSSHFLFCISFFYFPSILTPIPYIPFPLPFFLWQTLPLALLPSPRSQQTNYQILPPHSWGQHHGRLGRAEFRRGKAGGIIGGRTHFQASFSFSFSFSCRRNKDNEGRKKYDYRSWQYLPFFCSFQYLYPINHSRSIFSLPSLS